MSFEFGLGFGRFHVFENSASVPSVLKICKIQSSFRPNGSTLKIGFKAEMIIFSLLTRFDHGWPPVWPFDGCYFDSHEF